MGMSDDYDLGYDTEDIEEIRKDYRNRYKSYHSKRGARMATVKRTGKPRKPVGKTSRSRTGKRAANPSLVLPTELNVPSSNLLDYSILLYGMKKIGKTSLAARFPNAIFLSTEPGTEALRVYKTNVSTWEDFVGYVDLLLEGNHEFTTIVVDTADRAYEMCFKSICDKMMIEHPNEENDYGATWKKIRSTFSKQVDRLITSKYGVVFISHDTEKEIETRDGTKIDQVRPTMAKQAMEEIEGQVDIICNYCYDGSKRTLRIDGAQDVVAGCRVEEHFIRSGGKPRTAGDRIISIPMGRTAQEAYDNLIAAFENKQESVEAYPTTPAAKKVTNRRRNVRKNVKASARKGA